MSLWDDVKTPKIKPNIEIKIDYITLINTIQSKIATATTIEELKALLSELGTIVGDKYQTQINSLKARIIDKMNIIK